MLNFALFQKIGVVVDSKLFDIPYGGFKNGDHEVSFIIDDPFFEGLEYSEIKKSNVKVNLSINKQNDLFTLLFNLKGFVNLECERCLEDLNIPIDHRFTLLIQPERRQLDKLETQNHTSTIEVEEALIKQGSKYAESEIRFIDPTAASFNVQQDIYEYMHLSLPIQKIHPDNGCSEEALETIAKFSPEQAGYQKIESDPRWEALKRLK